MDEFLAKGKKMLTVKPYFLGLELAVNLSYSYLVYPFAVWRLGLVKGGITMTALSLVLSYLAIVLYDRSGKDWFGIEALKEKIERMKERGGAARLIAVAIKRGGLLAFIILSVKCDPFITTVYLRRSGLNCLDFRGRLIFLSSVALGNGFWISAMLGGGTFIKHLKSVL